MDLRVNQSPDAASYKGNAVAVLESTSSTIIQVSYAVFYHARDLYVNSNILNSFSEFDYVV